MGRSERGSFKSASIRFVTARMTPAVLVLLSLTLIAAHKTNILPIETLRVAVTDVMTPALSVASKPFVAIADRFDGFSTIRSLKAENIRLREENARLLEWYESALKMQAENKALKGLLNVKADPGITYVTTRVVSDPGGSFVKSVLIPVGTTDKVTKGSAVLSGHGLIGRVTEVGRHSSRVLLISDLNSRIPVTIQNTRTKAILAGKNSDMLRLERLPIDSGLSVGQRVVTSGDNGYLPAEIPIGTIVAISKEDGILVKPLADIDTVSHVQVVNVDADESLMTGDIR